MPRHPPRPNPVPRSEWLANLLWWEGRHGAALAMIRDCRDRAPNPDAAAALVGAENALRSGMTFSVPSKR